MFVFPRGRGPVQILERPQAPPHQHLVRRLFLVVSLLLLLLSWLVVFAIAFVSPFFKVFQFDILAKLWWNSGETLYEVLKFHIGLLRVRLEWKDRVILIWGFDYIYTHTYIHTHTYIYIYIYRYIYIYIYTYICIHVLCMCIFIICPTLISEKALIGRRGVGGPPTSPSLRFMIITSITIIRSSSSSSITILNFRTILARGVKFTGCCFCFNEIKRFSWKYSW